MRSKLYVKNVGLKWTLDIFVEVYTFCDILHFHLLFFLSVYLHINQNIHKNLKKHLYSFFHKKQYLMHICVDFSWFFKKSMYNFNEN